MVIREAADGNPSQVLLSRCALPAESGYSSQDRGNEKEGGPIVHFMRTDHAVQDAVTIPVRLIPTYSTVKLYIDIQGSGRAFSRVSGQV